MKFFYTILIGLFLISTFLNAQVFQSNFESWTGGNPDGWVGLETSLEDDSIMQITSGAVFGSNACQLINTESDHKRFTTQMMHIDAATSYEVKFWVKGKGDIRTGLYDLNYAYNSYINVNTASWTEFTQTVTASNTTDSAEFIISVSYTDAANQHLQLDSVVISETTISFISIYDIQGQLAASPYDGQSVSTGGIVTGVAMDNNYFIQSGTGPWTGIYVFDYNNTPLVGDSVTLTASVSEYNGLTELTNPAGFIVHSPGNTLPAISQITTGTMGEEYEGVLIKVTNATCTNADAGNGMWTINDGSGDLNTDDVIFHATPILNEHYDITGIGHYSFGQYKILPRDANDIIAGVNEIISKNTFEIFPIPATENINIISGNPIHSIELFNTIGELVYNKTCFSKKEINFDVTNFETGVYMLKVNYSKTSSVHKVVVE